MPIHGLDTLLIAVDLAFESGLPSTEYIVNIILRLKPTDTTSDDELFDTPILKQPALANVERYDALLAKEDI